MDYGEGDKMKKTLTLNIPVEDYEIVKQIADKEGLSITWLINKAVREYYASAVNGEFNFGKGE